MVLYIYIYIYIYGVSFSSIVQELLLFKSFYCSRASIRWPIYIEKKMTAAAVQLPAHGAVRAAWRLGLGRLRRLDLGQQSVTRAWPSCSSCASCAS